MPRAKGNSRGCARPAEQRVPGARADALGRAPHAPASRAHELLAIAHAHDIPRRQHAQIAGRDRPLAGADAQRATPLLEAREHEEVMHALRGRLQRGERPDVRSRHADPRLPAHHIGHADLVAALGGGMGHLSRAHGLTVDNLLAAELVTADGRRLRADDAGHPDLFWAICCGGGNFGVATRFRYRLRRVSTVTAGTLTGPATAATLAGFVAAAAAAPDAVTTVANVVRGGAGDPVAAITLVHSGRVADGPAAIAPFRALARPLSDTIARTPYARLLPPAAPERGRLVVGRGVFLDALDRDAARDLLGHLAGVTRGTPIAQLRVLGGAVGRVATHATAFAHHPSPVLATVGVAFGRRDEAPLHDLWAAEATAGLGWGGGGAYVNFLGDEGPARVRAAYPGATWERLRAIKRRHDPGNVFRVNHNIPPGDAP